MSGPISRVNGAAAAYAAMPRSQPVSSRRLRAWVLPPADPLERVLDLGEQRAVRIMAGAIILTFAVHGSAAVRAAYIHAEMIAWTQKLESAINHKLNQEIDIENVAAKQQPVVKEEQKEDVPIVRTKLDAPAPAAKAQHILAQNPDSEILNFGDNVFISSDNDRSPGGEVSSQGTNDKHVVAQHVAPAATGTGAPPPQIVAVDLSRTAQLAGSGDWRCPFPPEADADQVDEASAIIEVTVGPDGKAQRAVVLSDPGHGFGREARQCAMREEYVAALDREGKNVASSKKFRVKFER